MLSGRGVYHVAKRPEAKIYHIDITEKQGKKLLLECGSDFSEVIDKIYIQFGRLHIRDFENIMRFGTLNQDLMS